MNKQTAYEIASRALEDCRATPVEDLIGLIGTKEESTVTGPDGRTFFVEIGFERLSNGAGVRVSAAVDLGNSFKLERIEESIEIQVE